MLVLNSFPIWKPHAPPMIMLHKPEQRFFSEIKLIKTTYSTAGHIIDHANDAPIEQAASALCTKVVCHQGRPLLVFGIHTVNNINSKELKYCCRMLCK